MKQQTLTHPIAILQATVRLLMSSALSLVPIGSSVTKPSIPTGCPSPRPPCWSFPQEQTAFPFAMILAAYLPVYQLADALEELLAEPYRRLLPSLLDGAHNEFQINSVLPPDPIAMLRSDFQADFRSNVNNPLRQALLDNDTYAWTPRAPLRLIHSPGDTIAVYANAEVAYQSFTNRGACCVSLVDPAPPHRLDHDASFVPSLREVLTWFATFRP